MVDKIESVNIEKTNGAKEGKKINIYKDVLKGQEYGKKTTEADRQKAAELLSNIESEDSLSIQSKTSESRATPSSDINEVINNLNRPEAQEGIKQSVTNIKDTIKNSEKEPGIAGFLGKIMNKILR